MKNLFILIAMLVVASVNAQVSTGLRITSNIPTDKGMYSNCEVKFVEFYLNNSFQSQFNVDVKTSNGVNVTAFVNGEKVNGVYNYQLSAVPNINVMWDSVANTLRNKGLIVEVLQ